MKRFKFPFAYKPKVNLKNTIIYSAIFKQQIFDYLQDKYKCFYIDPAFIVDNKKSPIAYLTGDRIMSFDNKSNNSIFCFNSIQDNYLLLIAKHFKNQNIMMFAPCIQRDAKQTNLDSIINWEIDVELSIPFNMNMNFFADLLKQTYLDICTLTNHSELRKIYSMQSKIKMKKPVVIDAQKLESSYPTLSLQEAFNHFCSKNKFVIVENNIKKLKSGKHLSSSIATAQDWNLSCGLYVYDEVNAQPILLMNVCKRADSVVAKQQLLDTNPIELTNELYDKQIFEKDRPINISLVINFTNLLYFFLDKVHLAEVVKSVWPDEFLDFIKTEKIEIF